MDVGKPAAPTMPAPWAVLSSRRGHTKDANGFERQLHPISVARIQIHRLARTLQNVPVRKTARGRDDSRPPSRPAGSFHRLAAMHTRLDIHAEPEIRCARPPMER